MKWSNLNNNNMDTFKTKSGKTVAITPIKHASMEIEYDGLIIQVDPVIDGALPETDYTQWRKADIIIITHDHYDHLDCETIERLKDRVGRVICPLGVGEHLERWGVRPEQLIEMDWQETNVLSDGWSVHCLPSQHFSGRSFRRNNTLWASFLMETPYGRIFLGCDGGYGPHFREIGEAHPGIDLAILENGQYNEQWRDIHTMPEFLGKEAVDLGARKVITVHHGKYTLSLHPWDEPLGNELAARDKYGFDLIVAKLGEVTALDL